MRQRPDARATNPISFGDRWLATWVSLVSRMPWITLGLIGVLVALAVAGASRLSVDTDSSRMLSAALPFQARVQEINRAFPAVKNTIVVVVRSGNSDAADAVTAALTASLSARTDRFDRVFAPSQDPFLVAHGLLYGDVESLEERLSRLSQASNLLAELRTDQSVDGFLTALDRATALAENAEIDAENLAALYGEAAAVLAAERTGEGRPFAWSGALNGGGEAAVTTRLITLLPKLDFTRLNPARPGIEAVEAEIAALDPELAALAQIGVTGDPVLRAEELQSVTETIGLSLVLSLALVAAVLWLALGTTARMGLALGALVVTLVLSAGFAGVAVGALNLISIAFVVLMVGLGIDFAIHFLAHLEEETAFEPDGRAALAAAGRGCGTALGLSAATTSVAFLAFTTTDFVGMAQLGLIGGVGVLIAFAVAVTLIPAVVTLVPSLAHGRARVSLPLIPPSVARVLVWGALAVGLASLVLAPQARFDADPMGLRNPAAPSVAAYGWLAEDPETAPLRLSLLVGDAAAAERASDSLADLPEVRRAVWLGDLVPSDQARKLDLIDLAWPSIEHAVDGQPVDLTEAAGDPLALADRLAAFGTPEALNLAEELRALPDRLDPAARVSLDRALFRFFPPLIDRLAAQLDAGEVTIDDLPSALVERYRSEDGQLRVEISAEADITEPAPRQRFVQSVAAAAPEAGGPPDQIVGAAGAVSGAMLQAAGLALAGTALLAWLATRSVLLMGAILAPLALAGAVTMAFSVLSGVPFNYANVIVLPLMIGIGVDLGIHLALRTLRSDGRVFDTATPRAVVASAMTTVVAFGTLALSDHRGTSSMGVMLTVSLIASVAMIFALTPRLARLAAGRG